MIWLGRLKAKDMNICFLHLVEDGLGRFRAINHSRTGIAAA